jgi:hypothetical protein
MIYSQQWRVYDVVFSGISLIKTYKAQFDSHIKRKGIDSLTCGVLLSVIGPSAKIEANKIGNEEFLEPEALMAPCRGLPPWITNLYIYMVFL